MLGEGYYHLCKIVDNFIIDLSIFCICSWAEIIINEFFQPSDLVTISDAPIWDFGNISSNWLFAIYIDW